MGIKFSRGRIRPSARGYGISSRELHPDYPRAPHPDYPGIWQPFYPGIP
ncbi:hypothetical protein SLEP1_g60266, partial [Rubroshorea leprosula]